MSQILLRKHKAKSWLNLIAAIDMAVFMAMLLLTHQSSVEFVLSNSLLIGFLFLLFICNIYFATDYILTSKALLKDSYRKGYAERQIRFAIVCHVFDAGKKNKPIYFSQFKKARDWFYERFDIEKALKDEIAVCMTTLAGCYKSKLSFTDELDNFLKDHPIEDAYYTGLGCANANYPYLQASQGFRGNGENGMTLLYICETSYDFYEERVESKLKEIIYNQQRAVSPLSRLFESKGINNSLSIQLEFHKLDIN